MLIVMSGIYYKFIGGRRYDREKTQLPPYIPCTFTKASALCIICRLLCDIFTRLVTKFNNNNSVINSNKFNNLFQ